MIFLIYSFLFLNNKPIYEDLNSHLLTLTQLAEESTALNPHIYHDLLYVVPRVRVSRRTLQCRVRHLTPTYVMTNELQLLNYAINNLHLA